MSRHWVERLATFTAKAISDPNAGSEREIARASLKKDPADRLEALAEALGRTVPYQIAQQFSIGARGEACGPKNAVCGIVQLVDYRPLIEAGDLARRRSASLLDPYDLGP